MSALKFLFKQYIIAFIGIGIILGGCSGKIGNPDIPIAQAQKLFSEGQSNTDKKQAYLKYKTACYEGNHYPSCIEAKKILDSDYTIDKEEDSTNYTIQKVKIFQYLCDKDDLDGCQKLLKSWGDEYELAFPSKRQTIAWGADFPLVFLTAGLYIAAVVTPNGSFAARYERDRNKIPDQLREKIQEIANKQCDLNNANACLIAGKLKKGCELGSIQACLSDSNYQRACDLGGFEECKQLAQHSPKGDFSKFNAPREKACKNGDSTACLELAEIFNIRKQEEQTKNFANKACKNGSNEGCFLYSNLIFHDKPKESLSILGNMCTNGEQQACDKILETAQQYKSSNLNLAKIFSKRSCDLGSVYGCSLYADLHIETNFDEATKPLKKLCEKNVLTACEKMADIFLERNTKADKIEAIKYIKSALNIKTGVIDRTSFFEEKLEKAQNQIKKMDAFQNAKQNCSKNDSKACFQLADFYLNGEEGIVKQDKKKALELYADLCIKNKNAEFCQVAAEVFEDQGQYDIADNFYVKANILNNNLKDRFKTRIEDRFRNSWDNIYSGYLSDSDLRTSIDSCKNNDPTACLWLNAVGKAYSGKKVDGFELLPDLFKAVEVFKISCDIGFGFSCLDLSEMFFDGKGVKTDKAKAKELRDKGIKLLTTSCNFENGRACTRLASETLDTNPKKAFTLYAKGCELGASFACVQTGKMYEKGIGTAKNMGKAKDFYGKACDFQDQEGCSNYNRLSQ